MGLPKFLRPYLASYDISKLHKEDPAVSREVVTAVLNLGNDEAVKWLFANYGLDQIKKTIKKPQRGTWYEESLSYWQKILQIGEISNYEKAIVHMNP